MNLTQLLAVFAFIPFVCIAQTQSALQRTYIGKSECIPELNSVADHYGIRLDQTRNAYLAAYKLERKNILTIVQRKDSNDRCGTIRNVIQSSDPDTSFVWECRDSKEPGEVVIGTWPAKHPNVSGPAVEAWRIVLKQLRFKPVAEVVTVSCVAGNYAGSDEGDDLAGWAKARGRNRSAAPAITPNAMPRP